MLMHLPQNNDTYSCKNDGHLVFLIAFNTSTYINTVFKTHKEIINVDIYVFPKNMYFYDIYTDFTACFIMHVPC